MLSSPVVYGARMCGSNLFSWLSPMPGGCNIGWRSSNFHPLVGSVVELKEMVKEHIVFTNWDLLWDLGRVDPMTTNQGSQTSWSGREMPPFGNKPGKPNTGSPTVTNTEPARHTTPPVGTEGENQYLLVVITLIGQLSLESSSNGLKWSLTALWGGDIFQNPWMAAVLSASTRVVNYGGATMKELKEWYEKKV